MTPDRLMFTAIGPALAELESLGVKSTREACRFMLAIAFQESALQHRRQVLASGKEEGPASSFWQFEKNGGCKGVLTHAGVSQKMKEICARYNVEPSPQALWEAMRYNDIVAAAAARLLIFTLPKSLPVTADQGWLQYIDAWRPGKPHPEKWIGNWGKADAVVNQLLPEA